MNSRFWRPVAWLLAAGNIVGLVMALSAGEPLHALAHVGVGVGLAVWIKRLNERARTREVQLESGENRTNLEGLENQIDDLRRELNETQERLDFAERMLAQRPAPVVGRPAARPDGQA